MPRLNRRARQSHPYPAASAGPSPSPRRKRPRRTTPSSTPASASSSGSGYACPLPPQAHARTTTRIPAPPPPVHLPPRRPGPMSSTCLSYSMSVSPSLSPSWSSSCRSTPPPSMVSPSPSACSNRGGNGADCNGSGNGTGSGTGTGPTSPSLASFFFSNRRRLYPGGIPPPPSSSSVASSSSSSSSSSSPSSSSSSFSSTSSSSFSSPTISSSTTTHPSSAHTSLPTLYAQPLSARSPPHLLRLPTDALRLVLTHVMSAPTDVGRPVVTAAAWRQSLSFAYTCRAAYRLWASCLQYVDVSAAATSLTDAHLRAVVHTARHAPFHRLCARRCAALTATGIAQTLTPLFAQLRSLDLSHTCVDDAAMAALFSSVTVRCGDKAVTEEGSVEQGQGHGQGQEEEQKLSLASEAEAGAGAIARSRSCLSSLVVNGCTALTPRSLATVAACRPPLRFLDVGGLDDAVTDTSLNVLLGAVGSTLRTLIVSHCRWVSDVGLRIVGTRCPGLVSITLRGLPLVTDNGLRELCVRVGHRLVILDALDCTGLTLGGYMAIIRTCCPHIYRHICRPTTTSPPPTTTTTTSSGNNNNNNIAGADGAAAVVNRTLRDCIIATMPGLIYRISATDAIRRLPALYFLLLDESALRPFRVAVQGRSLNLSDFGTVLVSNFGTKPTSETRAVLRARLGHDSAFDADSDDELCADGPQRGAA